MEACPKTALMSDVSLRRNIAGVSKPFSMTAPASMISK